LERPQRSEDERGNWCWPGTGASHGSVGDDHRTHRLGDAPQPADLWLLLTASSFGTRTLQVVDFAVVEINQP